MPRHDQTSLPDPERRNRVSGVFFFVAALLAVPAFAIEAIKTYPSLKLKDGRQFAAVEILTYNSNGVFVRHTGGATTFRLEVLPDSVITALHLQGWEASAGGNSESASLADKPAVAEPSSSALAYRVAVADAMATDEANRPAVAAEPPLSDRVAAATETSPATMPASALAPEPANATPPPAGEGNMPEFFTVQQTITTNVDVNRALAGRVVITLPSGETHLLGDVEVRGYPAELLPGYLAEAKMKARNAAQIIFDQAAVATRDGRQADAEMLSARANRATSRYFDYLPAAPVTTRSDEFGYFTLQHKHREIRIVAAGRLSTPRGQWDYEWIGVTPQKEASLTEANATSVIAAEASPAKYAAR
jgi:hypothetical protein